MAYCTPEDTAYLAERGFALAKDGQAFHRSNDAPDSPCSDYVDAILPCWEGRRHHNDLDVPPGDGVFWQAVRAFSDSDKQLQLIVGFNDQQPTPISAYVTAEVRGWKREQV